MKELNERQLTVVSGGDRWCLEEAQLVNTQNGQTNYASYYAGVPSVGVGMAAGPTGSGSVSQRAPTPSCTETSVQNSGSMNCTFGFNGLVPTYVCTKNSPTTIITTSCAKQ